MTRTFMDVIEVWLFRSGSWGALPMGSVALSATFIVETYSSCESSLRFGIHV